MFPQLPENFEALDLTALKALRTEFKSAIAAARLNLTSENSGPMGQALADLAKVRAQIKDLTALKELDDAAAQAEVETDADEADEVEDEVDEEDLGTEEAEGEVEEEEEEEVADEASVPAPVLATTTTRKLRPTPLGTKKGRTPREKALPAASVITAFDNVPGKAPGEAFTGWTELAEAMLERRETVNPNSGEKSYVGRIKADYESEPGRVLDEDPRFNLARFDRDELTAALCAPFTPYYNLGCMNTTRRPVFNSLPQFQAPRGGVSIYPSPTLADITTGTGVWTSAEDSTPSATKSECQTIACASPVDYEMYAIYRCLTVKNFLAMTFPELLEAYLNRLAAAQARMAEARLLNLMGSAVTNITALVEKVGATESILSQVLRYFTGYQERQRWDFDTVDGWGPRWLLNAIKTDLMHRRNTNGSKAGPVSDAQVTAMFRDAGVNMTWFIDAPTWATPFPSVAAGGNQTLATWPTTVEILLAPAGKFALIDRGELRVGVTGNIFRDITSLKANDFTFFFESFEGIVDTDSCPADLLKFPSTSLCFNGVQVADVTVDCDLV